MHPQLSEHNNPRCIEQIRALKKCHADVGFVGKLTGACNEQKTLLDLCFRAQKKVKRKVNLEAAREDRARWLQACEEAERAKPTGGA